MGRTRQRDRVQPQSFRLTPPTLALLDDAERLARLVGESAVWDELIGRAMGLLVADLRERTAALGLDPDEPADAPDPQPEPRPIDRARDLGKVRAFVDPPDWAL